MVTRFRIRAIYQPDGRRLCSEVCGVGRVRTGVKQTLCSRPGCRCTLSPRARSSRSWARCPASNGALGASSRGPSPRPSCCQSVIVVSSRWGCSTRNVSAKQEACKQTSCSKLSYRDFKTPRPSNASNSSNLPQYFGAGEKDCVNAWSDLLLSFTAGVLQNSNRCFCPASLRGLHAVQVCHVASSM
jgi:hypothetical protein